MLMVAAEPSDQARMPSNCIILKCTKYKYYRWSCSDNQRDRQSRVQTSCVYILQLSHILLRCDDLTARTGFCLQNLSSSSIQMKLVTHFTLLHNFVGGNILFLWQLWICQLAWQINHTKKLVQNLCYEYQYQPITDNCFEINNQFVKEFALPPKYQAMLFCNGNKK